MSEARGSLYICATPIGNLEDITLRVLRTLKEVSLIAAEDTRRTKKLLSYYEISTSYTSYHEHNKQKKTEELINILLAGKSIALVSDAGMPGISDPGYELIVRAIELNIPTVPLPGASAVLASLVASGLNPERFVFYGFLSRQKKKRRLELEGLLKEDKTVVLFEAPHRLQKLLQELEVLLEKNRQIVVARELTKKYEEFIRGNITTLIDHFRQNSPKGEIVFMIEGALFEDNYANKYNGMNLKEEVLFNIQEGMGKKEAIKEVAKRRNIAKNEVYKECTDINPL